MEDTSEGPNRNGPLSLLVPPLHLLVSNTSPQKAFTFCIVFHIYTADKVMQIFLIIFWLFRSIKFHLAFRKLPQSNQGPVPCTWQNWTGYRQGKQCPQYKRNDWSKEVASVAHKRIKHSHTLPTDAYRWLSWLTYDAGNNQQYLIPFFFLRFEREK